MLRTRKHLYFGLSYFLLNHGHSGLRLAHKANENQHCQKTTYPRQDEHRGVTKLTCDHPTDGRTNRGCESNGDLVQRRKTGAMLGWG